MPSGPCPVCGTSNSACLEHAGPLLDHTEVDAMPPIYRSRERVFRDRPDLGPGVRELVYGLGSPIPLEEAIRQGIVAPSRAEVLDTATHYRAPAPPAASAPIEEAVLEAAG